MKALQWIAIGMLCYMTWSNTKDVASLAKSIKEMQDSPVLTYEVCPAFNREEINPTQEPCGCSE